MKAPRTRARPFFRATVSPSATPVIAPWDNSAIVPAAVPIVWRKSRREQQQR